MVDVGDKATTRRTAKARATVQLPLHVADALGIPRGSGESELDDGGTADGAASDAASVREVAGPKGPVFATAVVAGVMAAKKTSELIPFCHPLPLDKCDIDISAQGTTVTVDCTVSVTHRTGVEMEAMVGASVAALTVYDMVKALSLDVVLSDTRLVGKTGGKRDKPFT